MNAPIRILLVEDDAFNQRLTLTLLSKLGYTADLVVDGAAAVNRCRVNGGPDLILMDLHLAGLDGLEAARRIRALGTEPAPYIIALTGNREEESGADCRAAGMDDFLNKPFSMDDLRGALGRFKAARGIE